MSWIYDDGGRAEAGFKGETGDCVCRAISIATQMPYKEIYDLINQFGKKERGKNKSSARTGVAIQTTRKIMDKLGWEWVPLMFVGSGCKVHLKCEELPKGRIIAKCSKHVVAVIDGVLHDTYDASRDGTRCVYGYYKKRG